MRKQKIILDCDPGHDDAVAIMLAGRSPEIELLGITVVAGNQTLENTVTNTLNICQTLKLDVPVYKGCGQPMVRPQIIADDIHGNSGLDGPSFEHLTKEVEPEHAAMFLIKTLLNSEGDIALVVTGPMTNVAMAMRLEPLIIPKIKEIVLMGGSLEHGNTTPAAEFNIYADAEAAKVCFHSGRPITMVGLDVTRKALVYPHIIERMEVIDNKASSLFVKLMGHFNKSYKEVFGFDGGALHDPLAMSYLINPSILTVKHMYVDVDTGSEQSYGRTNCDIYNRLKMEPNVNVAVDVDVEKFWNVVEEVLKAY